MERGKEIGRMEENKKEWRKKKGRSGEKEERLIILMMLHTEINSKIIKDLDPSDPSYSTQHI